MGRKKNFVLIGGVVFLLLVFLAIILFNNSNKDNFSVPK